MVGLLLTIGCYDTSLELIKPNESVRLAALEGDFVTYPTIKKGGEGEGWFRMESGEVKLQWDDKAKSLFFDAKPHDSRLPKGARSSDVMFSSLRVLCVDPDRRIYLLQMMDPHYDIKQIAYLRDLSNNPAEIAKILKKEKITRKQFDQEMQQELARKPIHQILIVKIDEKGAVWGGEEETWFKTVPGLEKELASGDAAVALKMIRDNIRIQGGKFFEWILLGRGKLADYGK
jgi:hypothetical protein